MKFQKSILIISLAVFFFSCQKEELPIPAREAGSVVTKSVEMGADYRYQLFYDLGTNSIVGQNLKTDWDLGFENRENGWHIILNTARSGAVAHTGISDFSEVISADGLEWQHDAPSGNLDSTAFGDYRDSDQVFVIDRGYDPEGNHTGYRKMKVLQVNSIGYQIRTSKLDGSEEATLTVNREENTNFTAFSFDSNSTVSVEPPKNDWDLQFTQYTHIFHEPYTPYLVTGILSNRNGVEVAVDESRSFEEITADHISGYDFTRRIDAVGYEWKFYDFDQSSYVVFPEINYIIKDTEGRFFKLHFIDFYNDQGEKGTPKFEVQEL